MAKIGAHVSSAVSLDLSFEKAKNMGAEATQIFLSPPRQWSQNAHRPEKILKYKEAAKISGIGPNFIHGTYLVNLATDNPTHLQKSIDWLVYALNQAAELGMEGVIFHTGSHTGRGFETVLDQIINSIEKVFKSLNDAIAHSNDKPYLILENSAGAGGSIGGKFSELGQILKGVKNNRVKVCLDTAHAYAAGYDIKTPIGLKSTLEEFEEEISIENLVVIHANDSKFELGSKRDRHENIGEGHIGREGFKNLLNHPSLKDLPFIIEVPGFGNAGPDAENISILKSLRS